jgi:hypothetical protein
MILISRLQCVAHDITEPSELGPKWIGHSLPNVAVISICGPLQCSTHSNVFVDYQAAARQQCHDVDPGIGAFVLWSLFSSFPGP